MNPRQAELNDRLPWIVVGLVLLTGPIWGFGPLFVFFCDSVVEEGWSVLLHEPVWAQALTDLLLWTVAGTLCGAAGLLILYIQWLSLRKGLERDESAADNRPP